MTFADASFYLFSLFNGMRVLSYLPQIYRIAQDKGGAAAISYWTWGIWTAANASTGAYAFSALSDAPLAAINLLNSVCCAIVIFLTAFKRRQLCRDRKPSMPASFGPDFPIPNRSDSLRQAGP